MERIIRRKGLPFQSKVNRRGRNKALATQAEKMQHQIGSGLVIDFTSTGYKACPSDVVVVARGNRKEVERQKLVRPPGQLLGEDFLNCTIGTLVKQRQESGQDQPDAK